ncbi:M14 family zinc carboxypeptidase [Permianibacter aggregans]|uniref:Putative Ig domain-containing protein n=1 Tax=Permianibacter aggregans TaxID=1510150 RepID=A0A4R6ULV8_9GAMM|nr:M14 family zinc carboxypeptidase [Permianibacter aggregans]TDQ47642.1 putative Ig domain-containing protein [Permianibacter aggregans]
MAMNIFARKLSIIASAMLLSGASAATTLTYVENPGGSNTVALGYPVPLPIDSLLQVDGFRRYDSLHARHTQMDTSTDLISAINVGSTHNNRTVWAYQFSDADAVTAEGVGVEAGILINGGIHAREWQSPEVTTAIMERLFEQRGDEGLHQYLLENTSLIIIPVLNVDGFLQTQRFPNQVMRSTFSADPSDWPRDGRMRRKNMLGVDELLNTENDNLFGIDLNRNNNPFWASTNRSSNDNRSLVYHGSGPGSEPETQALYNAGTQFANQQMRLYIDMHSFSQLYYLSQTSDSRYNQIALNLGRLMVNNANSGYVVSPDPANSGIGTTQDYFAANYQVPSYTLEIEPQNSSAQYGGFGVTHDGFILPANQIARVRNELTRATLLAMYAQSGPPALLQSTLLAKNDSTVIASNLHNAQSDTSRVQVLTVDRLPDDGEPLQVSLRFNKPMRLLTPQGDPGVANGVQIEPFPSLVVETLDGNGNVQLYPLTLQNAEWLRDSDKFRYHYDQFQADVVWPSIGNSDNYVTIKLRVLAADLTGAQLDGNPSTLAGFSGGVWQRYDNEFDQPGDSGGYDDSFALKTSGQPPVYHGVLQNQSVQSGQALSYQFADNVFTDPEGAALSYEARSAGGALPSWLQFNATERRLSGTPSTSGVTTVTITAIDIAGNRTSANLTITVTSPPAPPSSGGGGGSWPLTALLIGLTLAWRRKER